MKLWLYQMIEARFVGSKSPALIYIFLMLESQW